jgi:hypothetical protein
MAEIVGGYMEKENVKIIKKHIPTKVNDCSYEIYCVLHNYTIPFIHKVEVYITRFKYDFTYSKLSFRSRWWKMVNQRS